MNDLEQEYANLEGRLVRARERLAVLKAREEEKKKKRVVLLDQLVTEGVNISDLEGEEERLQKEVREQMDEATGAVGRFEVLLEDRLGVEVEPDPQTDVEEV